MQARRLRRPSLEPTRGYVNPHCTSSRLTRMLCCSFATCSTQQPASSILGKTHAPAQWQRLATVNHCSFDVTNLLFDLDLLASSQMSSCDVGSTLSHPPLIGCTTSWACFQLHFVSGFGFAFGFVAGLIGSFGPRFWFRSLQRYPKFTRNSTSRIRAAQPHASVG